MAICIPISNSFREHVNDNAPIWGNRIRHRKYRTDACALILVETYFRPVSIVLLEYAAFRLLSLAGMRRADTLTLGLAQAKPMWWKKAGVHLELRTILNPTANYQVVSQVLHLSGVRNEAGIVDAAKVYNEGSEVYIHYAKYAFDALLLYQDRDHTLP